MGKQDNERNKQTEVQSNEADGNSKQKGRLTNNTISYFKRVDQVLTEDSFDDDELKSTFIQNVFIQVQEEGIQLLRHTLTSKVLEKIITLLKIEQFIEFLDLIKEQIELLCMDRFASHVVESTCLNYSTCCLNEPDNQLDKKFISFCKHLRKSVHLLLRDTYGCHVISVLLQVLSGVKVSENITKSRSSRNSKKKFKPSYVIKEKDLCAKDVTFTEVSEPAKKQFNKFAKAIIEDDNFGELLCHRNASPVLQVLLIVTSHQNKNKYGVLSNQMLQRAQLINNAQLSEEEDEDTIHKLPVVLTDDVGSHLVEVLLQTAGGDLYQVLSSQCFKNIIVSLCMHPVANFLAQTFLRLLTDTEKANFYVDKLLQFSEDILAVGHMGCIVRVVELIANLELIDKQKKSFTVISEALHIPRDQNNQNLLVKLILSLMTYDVFFKNETESKNDDKDSELKRLKKDMINYHGACILKYCFKFKKSKIIVESFLSFTLDELLVIACNPYGSFVFESFYESGTVPSKSKTRLSEMLVKSLYILSTDKFGSRVVDAMWKISDSNMRSKIQNQINEYRHQLKTNMYGRIILTNCELNKLPLKVTEMKEKEERKRKLLEDIVTAEPQSKKEKKQKQDDRALKYREQLKQLGISFDTGNV